MPDYGLQEQGFVTPTLSQIIEEKRERYQQEYGNDFVFDESNALWTDSLINAEREYQAYLTAEAVYNSQTRSGAEDKYLDDLYNKYGIYRNDETAPNGYAVIESDSSIPNTNILDNTVYFIDNEGTRFYVSSETTFNDEAVGFNVYLSDFSATPDNYTFSLYSVSEGTTFTVDGVNLSNTTNATVTDFFNSIVSLIVNNTNNTASDAYVTDPYTDDVGLHVGYADDTLVGITEAVNMSITPDVGVKGSQFFTVSRDTGFYTVPIDYINNVNPTSSGYLTITNLRDFTSGQNVESDAAYRIRAEATINTASAGTRDAIRVAVRNVEGVTAVRLMPNPTLEDREYANALTFNTIVTGGNTEDIAYAIYNSKPIDAATFGSTSFTVTTEDGDTEDIFFTRASLAPLSILIQYQPINNISLSTTEQSNIISELVSLSSTYNVGSTVFNYSLSSTVSAQLTSSRLSNLIVSIKRFSEDDSAYAANGNFIPLYYEVPVINSANITFERLDG